MDVESNNVVGHNSLEIFKRSWATYRAVLDADLMEHKSLTAALTEAVFRWLSIKPRVGSDESISVADLGCGDLASLVPLYHSLPLKTLCGVDMSDPALELAAINFLATSDSDPQEQESYSRFAAFRSPPGGGGGGYSSGSAKTAWINSDVLEWAMQEQHEESEPVISSSSSSTTSTTKNPRSEGCGSEVSVRFDLIICAFVIHHLSDENKRRYLRAILQNRTNPGGIMLMADVFRCNGEDRDKWLSRFHDGVNSWAQLTGAQRAEVCNHVSSSDYPASIEEFVHSIAPECGWDAEVVWTNSNETERLVVLRQAAELRSSGR